MNIFLSILVIAIAIGAYQYFRIQHYKKIGEILVQKTKPFNTHPANPTKQILVLGDSLAVGVGSTDPKYSIAGHISNDYPHVAITNAAISGSRTTDVIKQISAFEKKHFDLIVIQIGGNDVTHFTNLKEIVCNMEQIIKKAKEIAPELIVWGSGSAGYAPIFIPPFSWILTAETLRLYKTIAQVVRNAKCTYIELFVPWKDDVFKTDTKKYYAPDCFHVADASYKIWYEKCKPKIREVLEAKSF